MASACKAFTPNEEGCALSITSSSKFDMTANAFIQARFVASILIWSRTSCWGDRVRHLIIWAWDKTDYHTSTTSHSPSADLAWLSHGSRIRSQSLNKHIYFPLIVGLTEIPQHLNSLYTLLGWPLSLHTNGFFFFFFGVGKGGNASCTVTPKGAMCGTLAIGPIRLLDILPCVLPTKTHPCHCLSSIPLCVIG